MPTMCYPFRLSVCLLSLSSVCLLFAIPFVRLFAHPFVCLSVCCPFHYFFSSCFNTGLHRSHSRLFSQQHTSPHSTESCSALISHRSQPGFPTLCRLRASRQQFFAPCCRNLSRLQLRCVFFCFLVIFCVFRRHAGELALARCCHYFMPG